MPMSISERSVRLLAERGELAHVRVLNALRFAQDDVEDFVERQRRGR